MTAPARRAFMARFETEVDPRNELSAAERARRAEAARKAHFARLAQRSVTARRRAREQAEIADAADAELDTFGSDDSGESPTAA